MSNSTVGKLKKCPHCAEEILADAKKCKHCGEFLDGNYPAGHGRGPVRSWSPGVAAVLSVFVPGLGQIYKGDIAIGIVIFIVTAIGYVVFILPGLLIHIYAVSTAYSKPAPGDRKPTHPTRGLTSS